MIQTYNYNNQALTYTIIYKKRKTMGIYIDVYGNVELRVPKTTTDTAINNLLENKWHWIAQKSAEMKEKTKGFKEKTYEEGEQFLYLGESYPIHIIEDSSVTRVSVELKDKTLEVIVPERDEDLIKKLLTRFYKQQCKKFVESRIRVYQSNFKMKPKNIKISSNKKTWGTCNSLRELTFNWKLIMAPVDIVDYVVVHEMCHMIHLNHDRSFWRLVGKYIPNYEEHQQWLKESHWKMVV